MSIIKQDYGELSGGSYSDFELITYQASVSSAQTWNITGKSSGYLLVSCNLQYNAEGYIRIVINGTQVVYQYNGEKKVYNYVIPCNANDTIAVTLESNSYGLICYLS